MYFICTIIFFIISFSYISRLKSRCVEGCSSGSSLQSHDEGGFGHEGIYAMTQFNRHSGYGTRTPGSQSIEMSGSGSGVGGSISSRSGGTRGSTVNVAGKPGSAGLANLAGLLSSSQSPITNSPQASVDSNPNENSPIQRRVLVGLIQIKLASSYIIFGYD
jgi:hypothetical protein